MDGRMCLSIRRRDNPGWIMGGDFNFIESLDDKQGGRATTSRGARELDAWGNLIINLRLQDTFHMDEFRHINDRKFTWENRRPPPNGVATRIDRFYIGLHLRERGGLTGIWLIHLPIFDHSAIFVRIRNILPKMAQTQYFDRTQLNTDIDKDKLVRAWQSAV
jgi:hypothetical protein